MDEDLHKSLGLLDNPNLAKFKRFPVYLEPKGQLPPGKFTALGLTSGVGSMLLGSRAAGFQVLGNIEWRSYYRLIDEQGRNSFRDNFPGAFMARGFNDLDPIQAYDLKGVDLVMSHAECGSYSRLNSVHKRSAERRHEVGDIPLFLEYVSQVKPKYFVSDNLPMSFIGVPMSKYVEAFPEYDLYPEWTSNYGYGNPQKHRNRMFIIGSLKSEKYTFVPGETDIQVSVRDVIGDIEGLYGILPNHDMPTMLGSTSRFTNMRHRGDHPTWPEIQAHFKKNQKPGEKFSYYSQDGGMKVRISLIRIRYDHPSPVLNGGIPQLHPTTCLPLSIRERARIQGVPDDFIFYGTKFEEDGGWDHDKNLAMVKHSGKLMPVNFCTFVSKQIMAHIQGRKFKASNRRILKPNPFIDAAKQFYCKEVGYSNQEAACKSCWMIKSCNLPRKTLDRIPIDWKDLLR